MTTRTLALCLACSFALLATAPSSARACGSGALAAAVATLVIASPLAAGAAAQDIAFTVDDLIMASNGVRPSRNDGAVELGLNLPLVIGWTAVAATLGTTTSYSTDAYGTYRASGTEIRTEFFAPALIGALWSAGLAAHGLWAIANAAPESPARSPTKTPLSSLHLGVAPTLIRSGGSLAGGIGCAGTF